MSAARRIVVGLVLLALPGLVAADVAVRATLDPPKVRVGEQADLGIEIQGAQNAPAPSLPAVDGLTMRYSGPATQVSIVNGQMSTSVTHHFVLVPTRAGTFTIGPVPVTVGDKTYGTGVVTLEALAGGGAPGAAGPAGDQLTLTLSAAKPEVYLHERLPVTVQLAVGNVRVGDLQYPILGGDGFALEKFPEPTQRREQRAEGAFQVFDFRTVLTPLRSGTVTLGPATMHMSVLTRGRRSDPFFGTFFGDSRQELELPSQPLVLTVLPLPDEGRPAGFSGAVGRFEADVQAAPLALTQGDPVTVRSTIRGDGYLESVTPPAIAGSEALRVYPVQPAADAAAGEKVFEQVVIPQQAGTITLPAPAFSYFDPGARAYRTVARAPIVLSVRPSAQAQATPQIVGGTAPKPRPEALGQDLVSIKDEPGTLRPLGVRRWASPAFWLLQLVPLAAWAVAIVVERRRRRLSGDVRYARFTRAGRTARTALGGARSALQAGDGAAFHDAVARAVRDYLGAKLDLPPGAVAADAVAERLRAQAVPTAVADDVRDLLAACEHARFAPSRDGGADMQRTLARAEGVVRALERERRLARTVAAAWLVGLLAAAAGAGAAGETSNTLFFQGNTLYAEGRYADAAAAYERVLATGVESGNLYFNLGNARFRDGELGRAILAYERARRFIPGDPDLAANLGFARARSGDQEDEALWARLLIPLAGRAATDTLLLAASVAYALLMLALVAARFGPALARAARPTVIAAVVALALLVPAAAYRLVTVDLPARAVVVAAGDVAVRFEPSPTGTAHFQAKPGAVLRVLAQREGWAQVARGDGRRGWVELTAVATL